MERGDYPAASKLLGEAVRACSVDVDARRDYALALWRCGKRDEALAQMMAAMKLSGDDPLLASQAGEMYLAAGKVTEAEHLAFLALDYGPRLGPAWALRGRVAAAQGNLDQALSDSYRALELMHDDQQLLTEVASLNRRLGRPQQALLTLEVLGETYRTGEEPLEYLIEKGTAYASLGRYDDSIGILQQALRRAPSADLYAKLAEVQLQAGRGPDAAQTIGLALALDPGHAQSRALRSQLDIALRPTGRYAQ